MYNYSHGRQRRRVYNGDGDGDGQVCLIGISGICIQKMDGIALRKVLMGIHSGMD